MLIKAWKGLDYNIMETKITLSTVLIQDLISRVLRGARGDKNIPITNWIHIHSDLDSPDIHATVFDGITYYRVFDTLEGQHEEFDVVAPFEKLAKIFPKLHGSSNTTLKIMNNTFKVICGKSSYNIEIPVDENGDLVEYPEENYLNKGVEFPYEFRLQFEKGEVSSILSSLGSSLLVGESFPELGGIFIDETGSYASDSRVVSEYFNVRSDKEVLIPRSVAKVLEFMDSNDGICLEYLGDFDKNEVFYARNGHSVMVSSNSLSTKNYPITSIKNALNVDYTVNVSVDTEEMLSAIRCISVLLDTMEDIVNIVLSSADRCIYFKDTKGKFVESVSILSNCSKDVSCKTSGKLLSIGVSDKDSDTTIIKFTDIVHAGKILMQNESGSIVHVIATMGQH